MDTTMSLLGVEKRQRDVLAPYVSFIATILGIANLLASSYAEHFLKEDPTNYYLSLFLFAHSVLYSLLAFLYFIGWSRPVLQKTKIFPTSPMIRILFSALGFARHPISVAIVVSNTLALGVIFHADASIAIVVVLSYLLLASSIVTIASVLFLFLEKHRTGNLALVVLLAFVVLGVSSSFALTSHTITTTFPIVPICINAVQSARISDYLGLIENGMILTAIPTLAILLGKKVA